MPRGDAGCAEESESTQVRQGWADAAGGRTICPQRVICTNLVVVAEPAQLCCSAICSAAQGIHPPDLRVAFFMFNMGEESEGCDVGGCTRVPISRSSSRHSTAWLLGFQGGITAAPPCVMFESKTREGLQVRNTI